MINFFEKFKEAWHDNGGLVRTAEASRMLEVKPCRINQLIKEKKLKKFEYLVNKSPITLVSFVDVSEYKKKQKNRKNGIPVENSAIQDKTKEQ